MGYLKENITLCKYNYSQMYTSFINIFYGKGGVLVFDTDACSKEKESLKMVEVFKSK